MAKKTDTSGASRLADLADGREDILKLDPSLIIIGEGFNYRNFKLKSNKDHLKDTKNSIRKNGVQNPLWVRFDPETRMPFLIAGETRLRAVREILDDPTEEDDVKALVGKIPVIAKSGDDMTLLYLSLQENTQKPPSQVEVGGAYKRLIDQGQTVEDIADRMAQTPKYVKEAIALCEADPEIKQLVAEMAVTPSHAIWTIKQRGGEATATLKAQVAAARKKAAEKAKEKEAKRTSGKPVRGRKPAAEPKAKPVARPKKASGKYIKDDVIKLIKSALKKAAKSEDVDMSTMAESALEALSENLKE